MHNKVIKIKLKVLFISSCSKTKRKGNKINIKKSKEERKKGRSILHKRSLLARNFKYDKGNKENDQ
jgi:hypothetical protein